MWDRGTMEYSALGGSWLGLPLLSLARDWSDPSDDWRRWNVFRKVIRNCLGVKLVMVEVIVMMVNLIGSLMSYLDMRL